jgi:hypothetical protein
LTLCCYGIALAKAKSPISLNEVHAQRLLYRLTCESTETEVFYEKSCVVAVAIVLGWLGIAQAQVSVDPYVRKDGTYVGGHYRSSPDGNPHNNWSYLET